MRLLCVALALLIPGAAAAQQTDCTGQPIPMQGTYSYAGGIAEIMYDSDVAAECPSTFYLSVNSGPLVGLEVRYGALGDLSHGIVVSTNAFTAVHLDIAPRFDADDLYLGGIRTYDTFSLVAELASLEFDISEHGIGYFTLQDGVAPRCICQDVASEIESSQQWISIYSDEDAIEAAYAYNLMANENDFYVHGDNIIYTSRPAREVPGYPNLTYDDLLDGIYRGTLRVERNGDTYEIVVLAPPTQTEPPNPVEGEDPQSPGALTNADTDGDGLTDDAAGATSFWNCSLVMPEASAATAQCRTGIALQATHAHENTHVRQCFAASFRTPDGAATVPGTLRGPFVVDGEPDELGAENLRDPDAPLAINFSRLPNGITGSWPGHFPHNFPTSATQSTSIGHLRSIDPRTLSRWEVEAYTTDIAVSVAFRDTYCGGEAGRGDPADDGLFFAEDTVDPETGLPIENPDATK